MESAREFFVHELSDMLDAERKILNILEDQHDQTSRDDMRKAFHMHHEQTVKQIERLEQCFEELGEDPNDAECKGIEGLQQEKQEFMKEDPSEELIDMFAIGATTKVEHYEIASYNALVNVATKLDLKKVVRLLGQNLREEEQMLKKAEGIAKRMKPSFTGMEEEEEAPASTRKRAA